MKILAKKTKDTGMFCIIKDSSRCYKHGIFYWDEHIIAIWLTSKQQKIDMVLYLHNLVSLPEHEHFTCHTCSAFSLCW